MQTRLLDVAVLALQQCHFAVSLDTGQGFNDDALQVLGVCWLFPVLMTSRVLFSR